MIDNSTQLLTSNLNSNILYSVQASSNTYTLLSLFNTSNTYYSNQLLLKQNILTSSTSLLGDGSAITNLDYNKIALNKPSTFPADMTNIYSKAEVNSAITTSQTISSNYTIITSNNLQNNINTKLTIPTASTTLTGIGSNLTLIDYLNIKNPPTLNFLQLTGGTISGNITTQQLYINNTSGSTSSIFFNPTASIYALFSQKPPWAMYFAEDYNTTTKILPNYISNGRDATCFGTITKTTLAGNGATSNITYISGATDTRIEFPDGSIPQQFTILGLTRYNGGTRRRILQASGANWLHGHWGSQRGAVFYNDNWKFSGYTSDLDNWVCTIGKNVGATPGNILIDGIACGTASGGAGTLRLGVNYGAYGTGESSDWCLSCVMIFSEALTDAEMINLNTIINNYKTSGTSIKTLLNTINDDECVIESRIYDGTEKTELLLFKGNDATGTNGADRIRLRAGNIAFDTYSSVTTNRNLENIVMLINENGNVGIGTTNLINKLNVNGIISATSFSGNGTNLSNLTYNNIDGKPSTFPADMTNIYNKSETDLKYSQSNYTPSFTQLNSCNFLLKSGGAMTGVLTLPNNSWSIKTADNIDRMYFNNGGTTYFHSGNTNGDGFTFRSTAQLNIMTLTDSGVLTATSFSGTGTNISALDYNKITINKPTYFTPDPSLYYNQTQINNISNFNSNFTTQQSNILYTNKQNILTASTNLVGNGSAITGLTYGNITGVPNMNLYTTYTGLLSSNYVNFNQLNSCNFLLKSGGTMTGQLVLSKTDGINPLYITSTATNANNCIQIKNNSIYNAYIGIGGTNFGGNYANNFFIESASSSIIFNTNGRTSGSIPNMIINTSGYIGINTTNPNYMLDVYTDNTSINNAIRIRANTAREATLILDRSGTIWSIFNKGSGFGGATNNLSFSSSSTSHIMEITQSGNVGINNTSPSEKLDVTGNTKISGSLGINSTSFLSRFTIRMSYGDGNTGGLCIDSADVTNTYNLRLYSYVQAGNQVGYIFQVNNIASSVNAIILNYNGSVNIGNLQIAGYDSHYYLFNNTGGTHGDIGDFNNVSTFGYKFIQGTTNGPNTHSAGIPQYYSWSMGLGANYPYSQYVCQFGLPRNVSNPTLSVRYKENSSWGGWSGITAGKLNGTAIFAVDNWIYDSDNRQRFYFGTNGRTYYQGYPSINISHEFRGSAGSAIFTLTNGGSGVFYGSITANANSSITGDLSLFTGNGGTGAFYCAGNLTCTMGSVDSYGNDYLGVANTSAGGNTQYSRTLYIMFNTFTGIHRCFTNDPLYDNENPQKFKDDYMGRIVIASGRVATDFKSIDDDEWEIKYDKDGITIEDALFMVELSRKKKDKKVIGVLGSAKRSNSRAERLIINSVGEGAVWTINSNGNFENGDLITTSNYLGYGELQDSEFITNYTCGKITMDCKFELNSPYYNCFEIEEYNENGEKLRVAFVACVYYCG